MYKYGVSIFTGLDDYPREKNIEYLNLAKALGCEVIFSSAHINEATKAIEDLEELVTLAKKYNMKVSLDVSKPIMSSFSIPDGLYALRLDYGFSNEEIITLSNISKCVIELNASTISKDTLKYLVNNGLNLKNVRASFNYYPKLYTAHDVTFCEEMIKIYHQYEIPVLGFIPSKIGHRPPLYEGLPSIEKHRTLDTDLVIEEMKLLGFDEIAYGDAYASKEEIEKLKFHRTEEINILMKKEKNIPLICLELLEGIFKVRPDLNSYMIRMTSKRGKIDIEPFNAVKRKVYDVTIDNYLFKRYKGEICIILQDLPSDERVNVIGQLHTTEYILSKVKENKPFKIIPID